MEVHLVKFMPYDNSRGWYVGLGFRIVFVLLMQRRTQLSRTCTNVVAELSGDCISFEIQNENFRKHCICVIHFSIFIAYLNIYFRA